MKRKHLAEHSLGQAVAIGRPTRLGQGTEIVQRKRPHPFLCGIDVALEKHNVVLLDEDHRMIKRFEIANDRAGVLRADYYLFYVLSNWLRQVL